MAYPEAVFCYVSRFSSMLTAKTLLACFVPGMRYNTGFKKGKAMAGHSYGICEFRKSARRECN
jgi:hypothetical protein